MRPLLHDARAFAIVLAEDDERSPLHSRRGEIRERIGRHVRSNCRLPGDRTPQRIVDRRREHRSGSRLGSAGLEVHPELLEDGLGVGEHIHEM